MTRLSDVAPDGDRLATLRVLRDYLAAALDDTTSARDQAALAARLSDVLEQIEELEAARDDESDPLGGLTDFG